MATFDGIWDTVTQTPFGAQKATLTIKTDGTKLGGTSAGSMGTLPLDDGKIDGDRATWAMQMMGMTLQAEVTVDGDRLSGGISASGFGTSPISGQRRG
jgi:hypothetical protein